MQIEISLLEWRRSAMVLAVVWALSSGRVAQAQLEITEVMFNPLSAQDNAWEWIEVHNLGGTAVDLHGAYAARLGDDEAFLSAVDAGQATNTIIPAGGIGVLYDANLGAGNPSNFNDQQFRDAWALDGSVPLVGVSSFPALTNGGTAFGFWASQSDYANDLVSDGEGGLVVGSLANSMFSLDYADSDGTNPFPPSTNGTSMRWSGNGDNQLGINWALSALGETGVTTSTLVSTSGSTNSTLDTGSPGLVPAGPAAAGLLITEVMYNPRSTDSDWEWVEIFNNTGSDINFGTNNYVLDDDDNNDYSAANITSGSVANGTAAVLFDGDALSPQEMIDAWDPGGANNTNFIPVTQATIFNNNGGDTVAIWASYADYLADTDTGSGRTTNNATSFIEYADDNGATWPSDDGNGSLYLSNLSSNQNNGSNWLLSLVGDGLSFPATALVGMIEIHPGGDIGSPGTFEVVTGTPGDFDGDNDVDGFDFLKWQRGESPMPLSAGDLAQWEANYGKTNASVVVRAVPEPASLALLGLAVGLAMLRRR